ncbi:MAG: hypothetical protein KDA92_00605 [Planctomycetales bacterium]|nr:hypothetical protein [Planctomycetales bacterium]MCA9166274.1 hypothetical protein [Planctomycetales bacterium]
MSSSQPQSSPCSHVTSTSSSNPFATRWIQPGAINFQFPVGESLSQLIERLVANRWQGQIVGPHGSGKSTLLSNLMPALRDSGRDVRRFHLQVGQRVLPVSDDEIGGWSPQTLVVVDGYEQLSWWQRWRLRRDCRVRGAGLLVTTHRPTRLPLLAQTSTSVTLLRQLVTVLLERHPNGIELADADVVRAFESHRGNLREALLELYDVYQQQHDVTS